MTTWTDLTARFTAVPDPEKGQWLGDEMNVALRALRAARDDRNVVLYGSAFLQKPQVPGPFLSITYEDLNGLMAALHGMDWGKGLTLVLHTPGGVTNATESIVAYLRSKFEDLEVIVPTYAMSAGTMLSLAADRIWMGRHSQLGPIDPQMVQGGGSVSARAVVDQFARASNEITQDLSLAHAWAPVLSSLGPALLQEAQNALDYSEEIVARWLATWMLKGEKHPEVAGKRVAHYFNDAGTHKSHGRRIGRDEARKEGVVVEDFEGSEKQALQEAILTVYHVMTLAFEHTLIAKMIVTDAGHTWMKNFQTAEEAAAIAAAEERAQRKPLVENAGDPPPATRAERRRQERRRK